MPQSRVLTKDDFEHWLVGLLYDDGAPPNKIRETMAHFNRMITEERRLAVLDFVKRERPQVIVENVDGEQAAVWLKRRDAETWRSGFRAGASSAPADEQALNPFADEGADCD